MRSNWQLPAADADADAGGFQSRGSAAHPCRVCGQARSVAGEDAGGAGFSGQPCGAQPCRANARRPAAWGGT